jgi:hypothetical protein
VVEGVRQPWRAWEDALEDFGSSGVLGFDDLECEVGDPFR